MSRAQMPKQITNPPKNKKNKKMTYMKHGGQCKGMGAATRGGNYTAR
jgi:hypothetical protein